MREPVLETRNLYKSFGALKASEDVSINLLPGEIHALIGPNGAGKSTLIAQICGGLKPDSGSVHMLGTDITKETTRSRTHLGLGRTFQISALAMEDTVLQNAILGAVGAKRGVWRFFADVLRDQELRQVAEDALHKVGLSEHRDVPVAQLSHGQRRQLEVAIALTLSPKAFVMDEPMAGLGVEGSAQMTGFLDALRHQAPILLVEHDMDAVFALADRISVLVYGRVIASGTVSEIRKSKAVQEAYLGAGG